MPRKFAGKKFSGKHGTVIDAAFDIVKFCENLPEVAKISLGIIRQCAPGKGIKSIKIKDTSSGLELNIRGNIYVQTIYLYLENPTKNKPIITRLIKKVFV